MSPSWRSLSPANPQISEVARSRQSAGPAAAMQPAALIPVRAMALAPAPRLASQRALEARPAARVPSAASGAWWVGVAPVRGDAVRQGPRQAPAPAGRRAGVAERCAALRPRRSGMPSAGVTGDRVVVPGRGIGARLRLGRRTVPTAAAMSPTMPTTAAWPAAAPTVGRVHSLRLCRRRCRRYVWPSATACCR